MHEFSPVCPEGSGQPGWNSPVKEVFSMLRRALLVLLLIAAPAVAVLADAAAWQKGGAVSVNGSAVADACFLKKGRSLAFPVLAIAQALGKKAAVDGASVTWEGKTVKPQSLVVVDGVAYLSFRDLTRLEPALEYGVTADRAVFSLGARSTMPASAEVGGGDAKWVENFSMAQYTAQATKKRLLLDFTGSDWCGWCIKLDKEVFDTPEFKAYAAKNLVLVKVDFPRSVPQSQELKKQNAELASRFSIEGYPTLIVLSPEGQVLGKTGYQPGGPQVLINELESLK